MSYGFKRKSYFRARVTPAWHHLGTRKKKYPSRSIHFMRAEPAEPWGWGGRRTGRTPPHSPPPPHTHTFLAALEAKSIPSKKTCNAPHPYFSDLPPSLESSYQNIFMNIFFARRNTVNWHTLKLNEQKRIFLIFSENFFAINLNFQSKGHVHW